MNKLTPCNQKAICNNLKLVFKSNDINKLNNPTYKFVMNMSGFIAHYDLYGFRAEYENRLDDFAVELITGASNPEYWSTKWFIDQYGEEYCQAKTNTLIEIAQIAKSYLQIN